MVKTLIKQLLIEFNKQDRSGIYGITQRLLAYNSNRIEGSQLSMDHTISLFETGSIYPSDEIIKAQDIEEMNGHFLMFNEMLKTYDEPLTQVLIKSYHRKLKEGVYHDKLNGYPVGEYKNRNNTVANIETAKVEDVEKKMQDLLDSYNKLESVTLETLANFHYLYEKIHPFVDGNGRTGRIILFKECLKHNIMPFIIKDDEKANYYFALDRCSKNDISYLVDMFKKGQAEYKKIVDKYTIKKELNKEINSEGNFTL